MLYITIGIRHLTTMVKRVIVVQDENEFIALIMSKPGYFRWHRINTAEYRRSLPPPEESQIEIETEEA